MPNHITNWVEISGTKAEMTKLKKKVLKPYVDRENQTFPVEINQPVEFDFNGIVPMPKSLNIESGSTTDRGLAAFDDKLFAYWYNMPWWSEKYPGINTKLKWRTWLKKNEPETLKLGEQARNNVIKYGYKDWYEWSYDKWGTKWNAYDATLLYIDDTHIVVKFDTAWSSPSPIFDKLVEMGFTVNSKWQDEDPSNEGEYGDPYESFDINHPSIEVDYIKPGERR